MADDTNPTVVHEWRITGEPGQGYPYYSFVLRSDDPRWEGQAEQKARAQQAAMAQGNTWADGPYLHHRTVTYTPWADCGPAAPQPGRFMKPGTKVKARRFGREIDAEVTASGGSIFTVCASDPDDYTVWQDLTFDDVTVVAEP